MNEFLLSQTINPIDPTPMLILADRFEEDGDRVSADVFRSLVASEIPSLVMLSGFSSLNYGHDLNLEFSLSDTFPHRSRQQMIYGNGINDYFTIYDEYGCGNGIADGFSRDFHSTDAGVGMRDNYEDEALSKSEDQ